MKVFLSAVDAGANKQAVAQMMDEGMRFRYNLISYYYSRGDVPHAERVRDFSALLMVDSGAHTLQKNARVKWLEYTRAYARFIREFDRPNVVGYFEMDVDNIIGYDKVLELREILHEESGHADKIIPVWHRNRGIDDFKRMCRERSGSVAAITGFKNEDVRDEQYLMFLKYARRNDCKLHCLGMTRKNILDKVPFDYVDSSSWAQSALFGRVGGRKVKKPTCKEEWIQSMKASYLHAMKMQRYYEQRWALK